MAGSFSYTDNPANSALDAVRFLIRDTVEDTFQVSDEEITWALAENNSNVYLAAAECATTIALGFATKADKSVDGLSITYSTQARTYMEMAASLVKKGKRRSVPTPFAGGISVADKQTNRYDDSIVQPRFARDMHDHRGAVDRSTTGSVEGEGYLGGYGDY